MEKQLLIELQKVGLTVKGAAQKINVLKDVDLSVKPGESVSIIGPSGSGKTSLLMIIAGLTQATHGKVWVAGENITHYSEDKLAAFRRGRLAIVFQGFHLLTTMTALENVAIALELSGEEHAYDKASEALDSVGLKHRKTHYPSALSGGEQQRVALARAFATKPKLLLADEPTGNLDQKTGAQVMDLLFGLHEHYATTLMLITHDLKLAKRCGRQVTMLDGKLQA